MNVQTLPLITLYTTTIPVGEMGGLFSLPAYVVSLFLRWFFTVFSSGVFSSFWGVFFSVYEVMAGALFSPFT